MNFDATSLNTNYKTTVQIYMITFLIFVFLYINKDFIIKENTSVFKNTISKQIKEYQKKIDTLSYKKQTYTNAKILKNYDDVAKKLHVTINTITFNDNKINLQISSKVINAINFVAYANSMSKIEKMIFKYDKNILNITMKSSLKKYKYLDIKFITKNIDIKNPYLISSIKENPKAIIGDYVIINSIWYKKGDRYKNYTISKVSKHSIELKDKNSTIIMDIFSDE